MDASATPPHWPGPRPWVGREDILAALAEEAKRGLDEGGRVVLVEGGPGSGRTSLLHRFSNALMHRRRAVSTAYGDAADPDASAWEQIAGRLTRRERIGGVVKRSAAGWVGLIPIVGGVLEATIETGLALSGGDRAAAPTGDSAIGRVRMLLAMGSDRPRVVLLDNLDRGDSEELAGTFALVQRMRGLPLVLVATADPRSGGRARDLALEADRLGFGAHHAVPPFSFDDAMTALERATGAAPPASWARWWRSRHDGTPGTLWSTLGAALAAGGLRKAGANRWTWAAAPPADLPHGDPTPAPADVSEAEAALLRTAATRGGPFTAADVLGDEGRTRDPGETAVDRPATLAGIETALEKLARRGLLRLVETVEADGDFIDVFDFAHPVERSRWETYDVRRASGSEGDGRDPL